ncbi:MAG TPA: transposase [Desulfobacteraceae bacterium]|nr:transposase [Desulfobacteraceae bacterium]HPQ28505.1 transposase [Desulfobacteraceae bacterium]
MAENSAVYRPRNPNLSQYYQCVEDHFEKLEQVYDERFSRQYGFFRPYVKQVIYRYLDCGILHNGFARVRCSDCGHEYLLAFSCKRRHFCPSCHQKRVIEFGEWLCEDVLKSVPHRHFVFSIPKFLRRYFLYDRKLLSDLSRCGWESLKDFFTAVVPEKDSVPGAVIAVQTFGDFLGFHPHLHILGTDGCFYGDGMFRVSPLFELKHLEDIFKHKVFKMLLSNEKITPELVDMHKTWRHSGFNVFCSPRIQPGDEQAMENIARYIVRASFSQERMTYVRDESKVIYQSKDGKEEKTFDALKWLAAMCSHVPNKGEQMVRYYGYYSNVSRGKRKIQDKDDAIPSILEPQGSFRESRKNWARLIQKIYEIDPLTCPKCSGAMKVISVIENEDVIKKILKHLGLWEKGARPPPKIWGRL